MDLPLIGGHGPGTATKAATETCVNLFVDDTGGEAYLRNRYGYERRGSTTDVPADALQNIDDLTRSGSTVTVSFSTAGIRHGYDIGDSVVITGATNTDYNGTWTIDGLVYTGAGSDVPTGFTYDIGVATPPNETGTAAQVQLSGGKYKKEVRGVFRRVVSAASVTVETLYVVIGNRVYSYFPTTGYASGEDTSGTTRLASLHGAVSVAQLSDDTSNAAVICDGVSANMEGVLSTAMLQTAPSTYDITTLSPSNTVTEMDGRLIRDSEGGRGTFLYSDLYDASVSNSFNFATAEGSPDDLISVLADRRDLWLFGEHTTEIWYNAGEKNNPFKRFQGGFAEIGIAAPMTAKRFNNTVAWLARDKRGGVTVVQATDGFQPMMISTSEINTELEKRGDYVYNAHAVVINIEGHEFYVLTIPGKYGITDWSQTSTVSPVTFAYDSHSKLWFRWKSKDALMDADDAGRWFVTMHFAAYDTGFREIFRNQSNTATFFNRHIIGGRDGSGEIYQLTTGAHVDEHASGNQVIETERTLAPIVAPNKKRFGLGAVELETDQDAGDGGTVSLSYAKDGKTFTTAASRSVTASMARLMWKKLGRAYRWTLRFTADTAATTPVRWLRAVSTEPGDD